MRFLVDAQLPPALARWLESQGHEAVHVCDLGMASATDQEIWQYACNKDAVLITKDEDFLVLRTLRPQGAPVLWVRLGNTTKHRLLAVFSRLLPTVEQALASGETLIEIT